MFNNLTFTFNFPITSFTIPMTSRFEPVPQYGLSMGCDSLKQFPSPPAVHSHCLENRQVRKSYTEKGQNCVGKAHHKCVGDIVVKKIFWLGLIPVSIQFAQVSIASLYAVVTLYSLTLSGDPYLMKIIIFSL